MRDVRFVSPEKTPLDNADMTFAAASSNQFRFKAEHELPEHCDRYRLPLGDTQKEQSPQSAAHSPSTAELQVTQDDTSEAPMTAEEVPAGHSVQVDALCAVV